MSHLACMSLHKPCIPYKRDFDPKKMEEVRLQQVFQNGTTVKRNCLVFSGIEGAEGLLYVKDRFDLACEPLEFDTGP